MFFFCDSIITLENTWHASPSSSLRGGGVLKFLEKSLLSEFLFWREGGGGNFVRGGGGGHGMLK